MPDRRGPVEPPGGPGTPINDHPAHRVRRICQRGPAPCGPGANAPMTKPLSEGGANVSRVLSVSMLAVFASTFFMRALDPVIPPIAADLATDPATVALLSTAFALPYSVVQPVLGALADRFGKTRLMTISLVALMAAAIASAFAADFSTLLVLRIVTGCFAGGVFPVALAITGDLVPVNRRQVAISRLLSAAILSNLLGSPGSGAVADLIGWRGVFVLMGAFTAVALFAALIGFRSIAPAPRRAGGFAAVVATYRDIFRNPLAKICFGSVMIEAICLFGLFPYIALLLHRGGEMRASIAGAVIAGFGLGGIVYALTIRRMLARFGEGPLMIGGGLVMGLSLMAIALRMPWQAEVALFAVLGLGFYMLHGVIQIYATELLPSARGSTTALHSSFFFLGHALGPVVYGAGLGSVGLVPTVTVAGAILIAIGIVCSRTLRRDGSARPPTA
jgi:predicted MFS family arabinose efflux permease